MKLLKTYADFAPMSLSSRGGTCGLSFLAGFDQASNGLSWLRALFNPIANAHQIKIDITIGTRRTVGTEVFQVRTIALRSVFLNDDSIGRLLLRARAH